MQKIFWEELSKRGRHNVPNVAVRGKITSIVCQKAGDSHCLPLGCPSYMINPQINLGVHVGFLWDRLLNRMRDGKDSEVAKIYFNLPGSIDSRNPEFLHLPALLTYLAQHPQYELTFVYQTCEDKAWVNAWGKDNSIKSTQYQVKFFSEAPAWFNELESADLVLGYRIHGTRDQSGFDPVILSQRRWF